ncbi:metallophosphoesterase [Pseudomonas carassii]|uniref:Metallophosphoesterase n=1 Tax=Pseudomonas carassii TaxID=3115855 RepID=A0ABU7HBN8_9PSED|nr:metallophosphoesterase [Pseudomonas sp. 137P]MEE1888735.1 metallophosphoesterase [Pseudomonas sp. 137P]
MGDVHGHFELLRQLLSKVRFAPLHDRLFSTGDLVDRGPFSEQALEWLAYPWLHAVRGNHEQMAIDCAAGVGDPARHARNGGEWFHRLAPAEQQRIAAALATLPLAIEIQRTCGEPIGVIHADLPESPPTPDWGRAMTLLQASDPQIRRKAQTQALYARNRITSMDTRPVNGVDRLYVGHSTVPQVLRLGNVIYIDTGCSFSDGALTLIELGREQITTCRLSDL